MKKYTRKETLVSVKRCKNASSNKENELYFTLRKWSKYETRLPAGNNVSIKKWKNTISNKEIKQYCKLEESELKNETRLLKTKRVRLKKCRYASSKKESKQNKQCCKLWGSVLSNGTTLLKGSTVSVKSTSMQRVMKNKEYCKL